MLTLPDPQSVSQTRARTKEGGREVEEDEGGFDGSRPAVDWSAVAVAVACCCFHALLRTNPQLADETLDLLQL